MNFNELEVVEQIDTGAGQFIRVALVESSGKVNLDIRRWWTDDDGTPRPTTKGVSIAAKNVVRLAEAIHKASTSEHFSIPITADTNGKAGATPAKPAAKKAPARKRAASK